MVAMVMAGLTCAAGCVSAWLWFAASRVQIVPAWAQGASRFEPLDAGLAQAGWTAGMLQAAERGAGLNAQAALWSGLTAFLGGMSPLVVVLVG